MADSQEQQARIGAAITHAETLQKQAEAQQESAAQLLVGIEERAKALGVQEQRLAGQIAAFAKQVERLGAQAFAGGQAAVAAEVRAALKGVSGMIGEAAREITDPARETLAASLSSIKEAEASLNRARKRFSWWIVLIIAATAAGAFAIAGAEGFAMIGWQRYEIAGARQELAELRERLQNYSAAIAEMEKKERELDARGVRFETTTCRDDKNKNRLCVEIDPKAPPFSADDGKKQYRVPKGF